MWYNIYVLRLKAKCLGGRNMTQNTSENVLRFALPISKIFSPTIMQSLYDMGYREGVDKIAIVTNYYTETTSIKRKHAVKYGIKKAFVYEIMIPDKYVSKEKPKTIEINEEESFFNIPLNWVFSNVVMYNLKEMGYTPSDRCDYKMNYETHITTLRQEPKIVEGCKYFTLIIPDQYVKPRKEE